MARRDFKSRYVTVVDSSQTRDITSSNVSSTHFDSLRSNCVTVELWVAGLSGSESLTFSIQDSDTTTSSDFEAVTALQGANESITVNSNGVYRISYVGDKRYVRGVADPTNTISATATFFCRLDELETAPRD